MNSRFPLAVQRLEDRWCPAVTASLRGGTLTISGTADNGSIAVVHDATTAGTFQVLDGTTAVSDSPFTGVTRIRMNLTDADDKVSIDLGGQALSGNVTANLGDGANEISVINGELGRLSITAGEGDDAVTLGDGSADLSVRSVNVSLFDGIDSFTAKSGVEVDRSLVTAYVNEWTMEDGSTADDVFIRGGTGGNTVEVGGDVAGDLIIDAFYRSGSDAGTTVNVTGAVEGSVLFAGSDQDDSLTVAGDVGRHVAAYTFGGVDSVTINGSVGRSLALNTGAGDDTITVANAVEGRTVIGTGSGDDALTFSASADLTGAATVNMGAGDDTVTLDDAAVTGKLRIAGGSGTNTFVGTNTRTGLTLIDFGDASTETTETQKPRGRRSFD